MEGSKFSVINNDAHFGACTMQFGLAKFWINGIRISKGLLYDNARTIAQVFFPHLYNFDHSTYDITAKEVLDIDEKAAVLEMSNF